MYICLYSTCGTVIEFSDVEENEPYRITSANDIDNPNDWDLIEEFGINDDKSFKKMCELYNDYRDFSPYSKYEFYLPYCGSVELSGESFLGDRIKIFYLVNYEDATSTVYIYNTTKDKILYSNNATLGVKVGLSSSNATEIKDQKNALALNTALGVIGGVISVGAGVYSGNAYATATGALSITSTIGNAITKANQLYDLGKVEISSGVDGLSQHQHFYIKNTEMIPVNYNEDYAKLFGKPLNEYRKLNTLHGFTTVGNLHIENIASASRTEHDQLKALLEEGIIL